MTETNDQLVGGLMPELTGVRDIINLFLSAFTTGAKVTDSVSVSCKSPVEADISVKYGEMTISFSRPNQPVADLGGWLKPSVSSVTITPKKVVLGLGGLYPDITLPVVS